MLCGYIYVSISGCGVTELECPCSLQWKRNLVSLYRHTNDALYRYIYWLQIMFNARKPFSTAEKIQKNQNPVFIFNRFWYFVSFAWLFYHQEFNSFLFRMCSTTSLQASLAYLLNEKNCV